MNYQYNCRFCKNNLKDTFVDLGISPISNEYIKPDDIHLGQTFYPLHVFVCKKCFLVQIPNVIKREKIFNENYAYYSSYSDTWLSHAKKYVEMVTSRFSLNKNSLVVEVASNDGYLLQYFLNKHIPVLGIEPTSNTAEAAIKKGVQTLIEFFGKNCAINLVKDRGKADLIIGNNVLAHVPDINDFVGGLKILLSDNGVVTMEFPHIKNMIELNQFDTIYHEHYSYFSFITVQKIFKAHGLEIFDVEQISTHGGSLRIFAKHINIKKHKTTKKVHDLIKTELEAGYKNINLYTKFHEKVLDTKYKLLKFLIDKKRQGKTVVAYGAPAKGNTLLNFCGIKKDLIEYTMDRNPYKQGSFLPGSLIPIYSPEKLKQTHPDYVLILPWNIKDEIIHQLEFIRGWGAKFVVPIPKLKIL